MATVGPSWPRAGGRAGGHVPQTLASRGAAGLALGWWPLQEMPQVAFSTATSPVVTSWASMVSCVPHRSPYSPRLALCFRNPAQPWLWGPQCPIFLLNHWGTLGAVEEWLELEDIKTLLVPAVVDTEPVAQVGAGPH